MIEQVLVAVTVIFVIGFPAYLANNRKVSIKVWDIVEKSVRPLSILGILLICTAFAMPFIIRGYYKSKVSDYETVASLGSIGDFIGGTTVAFLTAASVFLLLATIIMQRKEIKISQQSINELVKQTEATVQQAQDAREETKITNETMKKQQFETTFFNMITLHQSILQSIQIQSMVGREGIKHFYSEVQEAYEKKNIESIEEFRK